VLFLVSYPGKIMVNGIFIPASAGIAGQNTKHEITIAVIERIFCKDLFEDNLILWQGQLS
jgi:hypothetical protein